jgi:hypothetical protein
MLAMISIKGLGMIPMANITGMLCMDMIDMINIQGLCTNNMIDILGRHV